jgi:hypothetical protein
MSGIQADGRGQAGRLGPERVRNAGSFAVPAPKRRRDRPQSRASHQRAGSRVDHLDIRAAAAGEPPGPIVRVLGSTT